MATTVTSTKSATKDARVGGGPKPPGPNGKGPRGNGWHGDGKRRGFSPAAYRITMWVVLAAVVMMFAALSGTYIFLSLGDQWRPISAPRMFFLSTVVILISSVTFEVARQRLKLENVTGYKRWLVVTLMLGLGFLTTQWLAWKELRSQGVYLASNPHSSFFYLFTGVHGVHIIGGILALLFLVFRFRTHGQLNATRTNASTEVVSRYWHVMDGLWIWLFLLLSVWG